MPKIATLAVHSIDPERSNNDITRFDTGAFSLRNKDGDPLVISLMYSAKRLKRDGGGFFASLPDHIAGITGLKEVEAGDQKSLESAVYEALRQYARAASQHTKVIGVKVESDGSPGRFANDAEASLSVAYIVAVKVELDGETQYFSERPYEHDGEQRVQRTRVGNDWRGERVWIEHTDEREAKLEALRQAVVTLGEQISAFVGQTPNSTDYTSRRRFNADELPAVRAADAERIGTFLDGVPLGALSGLGGTLALTEGAK